MLRLGEAGITSLVEGGMVWLVESPSTSLGSPGLGEGARIRSCLVFSLFCQPEGLLGPTTRYLWGQGMRHGLGTSLTDRYGGTHSCGGPTEFLGGGDLFREREG